MRLVRHKRAVQCEISLTPLIDVVFQLIIFAMLTSQFAKALGEPLELPEARRGEEPAAAAATGRIVVNVPREGGIIINKESHTPDSLSRLLAAEAAKKGSDEVSVTVRSDRRTPWLAVARVLEACGAARIARVKVAVVPPGEEGRSP